MFLIALSLLIFPHSRGTDVGQYSVNDYSPSVYTLQLGSVQRPAIQPHDAAPPTSHSKGLSCYDSQA